MEFAKDFSSNDLKNNKTSWRKEIIIGIISSILVIALIVSIIIIVIASSNSSENDKSNKTSEIGVINCIYDIQSTSSETQILGLFFNLESKLDIYIDDKKVKYTKSYLFDKSKEYSIQYKIYDNFNMDFMFQDISSLISVEFISNKNAVITSMISSFENSENLESFSIKGFNTDTVKSMHKLFYNDQKISNINLENFVINNVEDISYMFF